MAELGFFSGSVPYGKGTAYLPVIDLLRTYFQIDERDDAGRVRDRVVGRLLTLGLQLELMVAPILSLLNVPVEDLEWEHLEPPQRRQRILDACKRLLLRESQAQPLLLVFEDLHWIDTETQAFLDTLVESLPATRVLLLVSYRPEYQNKWATRTYCTQLRIDPLTGESAEALLEVLLGGDPSLVLLKQMLSERTEGNPLFVEESVRAMLETDALRGARGNYRLTVPLDAIQVPATVQAVLSARIDRLAPEDKRLLPDRLGDRQECAARATSIDSGRLHGRASTRIGVLATGRVRLRDAVVSRSGVHLQARPYA